MNISLKGVKTIFHSPIWVNQLIQEYNAIKSRCEHLLYGILLCVFAYCIHSLFKTRDISICGFMER
ncbi:unnamed protein product [Paramecium octaurelia]|uniref:Uncharacterized protein n=1 Tax=Paramecium octaurelia TaxID=43137 RepID=A0A8S1TYK6_PAROT|nr:unnamed protein product [Paramecium octaurelia]